MAGEREVAHRLVEWCDKPHPGANWAVLPGVARDDLCGTALSTKSARYRSVLVGKGRHYRLGISQTIARSTLADANERRDWRIYAEFAQRLIARGRTPVRRRQFRRGT